jgi:hypothetical protein
VPSGSLPLSTRVASVSRPGLWTPEAVREFLGWRVPCLRVLLECMERDPDEAVANAHRMLALLPSKRPPVLLHAEGPAVWVVLREAVKLGLDTRVGLEDTRVMPDGTMAAGNADLVDAAVTCGAT